MFLFTNEMLSMINYRDSQFLRLSTLLYEVNFSLVNVNARRCIFYAFLPAVIRLFYETFITKKEILFEKQLSKCI